MSAPPDLGWAVVQNGKINLRTVSDTRRAAMVNGLWLDKVVVMDRWTDAMIEDRFRLHAESKGWELVCVRVEVSP